MTLSGAGLDSSQMDSRLSESELDWFSECSICRVVMLDLLFLFRHFSCLNSSTTIACVEEYSRVFRTDNSDTNSVLS